MTREYPNQNPDISELMHYGVKGMKWGVRNDAELDGVSGSTKRDAKKDAAESARAKLFYGEGAGTRRKLIKATVEAKSKRDASYKKAFDHYLSNQDLSKHASKAKSERKRKDAVKSVDKTARGIKNAAMGNAQYASYAALILFGIGNAAIASGAAAKAGGVARQAASTAVTWARNKNNERYVNDFLRNMGL